jgi:uncharacterized membrane protein YqiK
MDISVKVIEVDRKDSQAILCKDGSRVSLCAALSVKVLPDEDSVLRVANAVGCQRASDPETIRSLFDPPLTEALEANCGLMTFDEIAAGRDDFRDAVMQMMGQDHNGFHLHDLAIKDFQKVPDRKSGSRF